MFEPKNDEFLLERFSNNLEIAEKNYMTSHNGQRMSKMQKLCIIGWLEKLTEYAQLILNQSVGQERANILNSKRFFHYLIINAFPLIMPDDNKN